MENPQNVLFIAYEPWETVIGAEFLRRIARQRQNSSVSLLVADPYQIRTKSGAARIKEMMADDLFDTYVAFADLLAWQEAIAGTDEAWLKNKTNLIADKLGLRDLEELLTTDPHLTPRERRPFYAPLSELERRAAGLLVIDKVIQIFEAARPTTVVMLWDQYLVKNTVGRICDRENIDIRVFRRTRFQDFLKLDYFFLPNSQNEESLQSPNPQPEKIIEAIESYGDSLYPNNLASQEVKFLQTCHSRPFFSIWRILRRGWRRQLRKFRAGPLSRPREFRNLRFWTSHVWRVHLYLFNKTLRATRYIFHRGFFLANARDIGSYILVPLHFRPESAILTQGSGLEDDDVVQTVSSALERTRSDTKCLVLEHPSMIEDRRHRFYRELLKLGNVHIADPVISTRELVKSSAGVVTISGTVALEASILEKPVHVAGYPEFLRAIDSRGFENIEEFVSQCIRGNAPVSKTSVVDYLARHCDGQWRGDLGWSSIKSEEAIRRTVDTLDDMFSQSL